MKKVAVILTVFNRIEKTLKCLQSLYDTNSTDVYFKVFLTDDGSTDGTREAIQQNFKDKDIVILQGSGSLYWNAGMNNSWGAAIEEGGFDGYLWLNNDAVLYANLWSQLSEAENYSQENFNKGGIYVGSTCDMETKEFTYGGFVFSNKITLKDVFLPPNGQIQSCEAAHGNITYVSHNVVESEGIFNEGYLHGGGDHDYTYLAYKHGFPVLVMSEYVGECENDHKSSDFSMNHMTLKQRLAYVKSPLGYNLNNALLFQKRCFPYRYPFVYILSYFRLLFPSFYNKIYYFLRK